MTFLRFFENFEIFMGNLSDNICMHLAWLVSSTSLSGGNQVDGLPPASSRAGVFPMESNTKTIAERARVEPRTQVHMTMKKLF